jgi:hypothetical protein
MDKHPEFGSAIPSGGIFLWTLAESKRGHERQCEYRGAKAKKPAAIEGIGNHDDDDSYGNRPVSTSSSFVVLRLAVPPIMRGFRDCLARVAQMRYWSDRPTL